MKVLCTLVIVTFVYLEVTADTNKLSKELIFESGVCDSFYSCTDCYTARICLPNTEGALKPLMDVRCSPQRPYCDRHSGTCVSQRPTNCSVYIPTNSVSRLVKNICNSIFSCNNCRTAQICKPTNNGFVFVKTLPCPKGSPYCDPGTGTCGTRQSIGCGKKGEFACLHDGKFPSSDCKSYYVCKNTKSVTFSCVEPDEHFDPTIGRCSDQVACQSFSCLNSTAMKVPHPLDPRYFAFCGAAEPIVIDSCPAPYELNVTSQICEATCHSNGLIQDLDDCHFYYKCTLVVLSESVKYFIKEKKQCPKGQAYDPREYLCVSDTSTIPGCKM